MALLTSASSPLRFGVGVSLDRLALFTSPPPLGLGVALMALWTAGVGALGAVFIFFGRGMAPSKENEDALLESDSHSPGS